MPLVHDKRTWTFLRDTDLATDGVTGSSNQGQKTIRLHMEGVGGGNLRERSSSILQIRLTRRTSRQAFIATDACTRYSYEYGLFCRERRIVYADHRYLV